MVIQQKKLGKTLENIYKYMETHGGITQAEAFLELGVGRLGARIFDMRERGIPIKAQMVQVRKKDGTEAFVARYSIEKEADV